MERGFDYLRRVAKATGDSAAYGINVMIRSDSRREGDLEAFLGRDVKQGCEQFTYQKLPERGSAIRLMRLLPGNDLDEIRCSLETSSLDVGYEALSYCWGKQEPLTPILCDGKRLEVTHNLKLALNGLRLPDRERTLWVDAVCINQKDNAEREQQVMMMGKIYGRARRTVVYLGEASFAGRIAFGVLRQMHQLYWEAAGRTPDFTDLKARSSEIAIDGYDAPIPYYAALGATQALAATPWFTRMWVLQEVALARDVLMVCAPEELEWDVFEKGTLMKILLSVHDTMSRELVSELDAALLRLIALRQGAARDKQDRGLLTLLSEVRSLSATDPRDKVYAILGLTKTDLSEINLRVDYKISAAQLYIDLAKNLLLRDPTGLDILSIPRPDSPLSSQMPSWVPDWSHPAGHTRPLVLPASRYGARAFYASGDPASSPPPVVEEEREGLDKKARLIIQGYVFDRVAHLSRPSPTPGSASDRALAVAGPLGVLGVDHPTLGLRNALQMITAFPAAKASQVQVKLDWPRFLKRMQHGTSLFRIWPDTNDTYAPTNEEFGVAYVRTLCADSMPYELDDMVRSFKVWCWASLGHLHGMWNQLNRLSQIDLQLPRVKPHQIDFSGMMEMMLGRRLMWSRDGYVGAVPNIAREGDAIVLAHGCRVPLVLREAGGGAWELVGDCYVHGIMYGERFESRRCGKIVLV
ncbi:hypothetical protein DL765_004090 [Monosporascus sp. GIB2]|nr:hypothetical protein DL765_004090 [Monosporascus sp. GIB2]